MLLLSPKFQGKTLGTAISAFESSGRIYLPLTAIARMFEISVQATRQRGVYRGFIISEDRTFTLDTNTGAVFYAGELHKFEPSLVSLQTDDIYVESALLKSWLPLEFDINRYAAVIDIRTLEKTPLELRLERENRLGMFQNSEQPVYPRLTNAYRAFDGPFIDQSITVDGSMRRSGPHNLGLGYSTYAAADLAYLEGTGYLNGTREEPLAVYRWTLGRHDYYGRLLGPLGARAFEFGDVFLAEQPLVTMGGLVQGAYVSSFPLQRPTEVQSQTLRGNLPPGWMVELYRDGFLVDYRKSGPTGEYEFANVPLRMGRNDFTLVFYGPYGEKREESYYYSIADNFLERGDVNYRLGGGQDLNEDGLGLFGADFGVSKFLTLTSGVTSTRMPGSRHNYANAGWRTLTGPIFWRGDFVQDLGGDRAYQVGAQTYVSKINLLADYRIFDSGFVSELSLPSYPVLDRVQFQAQSYRTIVSSLPLDLSGALTRTRYRRPSSFTEANLRAASVFEAFSAANQFNFYWAEGQESTTPNGRFSLARNVDPRGYVRLYGAFIYTLQPQKPRGFSILASGSLPFEHVVSLGFSREFAGASTTELGLSKIYDRLGVNVTGRYGHPGDYSALLMVNFGVGYIQPKHQLHIEGLPLGSQGAVVARVFLDENNNGAWDAGEQPVPRAKVLVNGTPTPFATDGDGLAVVTRLQSHTPANLSISANSLEESSWLSTRQGVSVVPRPGRSLTIDFPVIPTGEIDGTVFIVRPGGNLEGSGISVELLNSEGTVVFSQVTAYDGFFLFTHVPAGVYTLRASRKQAEELGYTPSQDKVLKIDSQGTVLFGNDLFLNAAAN